MPYQIINESDLKCNKYYSLAANSPAPMFYFGTRNYSISVFTDFGKYAKDVEIKGKLSKYYGSLLMPEAENDTWTYEINQAFFAGIIASGKPLLLMSDIDMYLKPCGNTVDEILWLVDNGFVFFALNDDTHTLAIPQKEKPSLKIASYKSKNNKDNFNYRKKGEFFSKDLFVIKNLTKTEIKALVNDVFSKFNNIHHDIISQRNEARYKYSKFKNIILSGTYQLSNEVFQLLTKELLENKVILKSANDIHETTYAIFLAHSSSEETPSENNMKELFFKIFNALVEAGNITKAISFLIKVDDGSKDCNFEEHISDCFNLVINKYISIVKRDNRDEDINKDLLKRMVEKKLIKDSLVLCLEISSFSKANLDTYLNLIFPEFIKTEGIEECQEWRLMTELLEIARPENGVAQLEAMLSMALLNSNEGAVLTCLNILSKQKDSFCFDNLAKIFKKEIDGSSLATLVKIYFNLGKEISADDINNMLDNLIIESKLPDENPTIMVEKIKKLNTHDINGEKLINFYLASGNMDLALDYISTCEVSTIIESGLKSIINSLNEQMKDQRESKDDKNINGKYKETINHMLNKNMHSSVKEHIELKEDISPRDRYILCKCCKALSIKKDLDSNFRQLLNDSKAIKITSLEKVVTMIEDEIKNEAIEERKDKLRLILLNYYDEKLSMTEKGEAAEMLKEKCRKLLDDFKEVDILPIFKNISRNLKDIDPEAVRLSM